MNVPLLDLKAQYATIKDEIDEAVRNVFESQWFIGGPKVEECERRVAEYCHCPHGVGVSSGTDALLICLMAEEIGPGDEVITTPYSFFATVGCISRVGATPVFADICPVTYNIDPSQIAGLVTKRTKAILPVHLFGQCAEMDPILDIAHSRGLVVIEDAAQAIGAEYKGRRAGSMGHYGCFSFFPSKNLGGAGDGGMVITSDTRRAETLRTLRAHGSKPKYYHGLIGGNFRLDAIQAAIVATKLRYLDAWTAARQENSDRYRELAQESGLLDGGYVDLPEAKPDRRHIYNQFVVSVPRRDRLRRYLAEKEVSSEVYYPVPLHMQNCFEYLGYREGQLPASENAARTTLAIPVYPELSTNQQQYVVAQIRRFFARC